MADDLKNRGNKAFQAKDYDTAISLFTEAIELDPNNFVLFSNRSAAKAGKKQWAAALEDAEQVLVLAECMPSIALKLWGTSSASRSTLHGRKDTHAKVLRCTDSEVMMKAL